MLNKPNEFHLLIDAIESLPTIGKRNAQKIALHLVNQDWKYIDELVNRIINAKTKIKKCIICNNLTTHSICEICKDTTRDHTSLCVVSNYESLNKIEESLSHKGVYYVLHGELMSKNTNSDVIEVNLQDFINRVKEDKKLKSIIIATSFTYSGEYTSQYIIHSLMNYNIDIYRIGFGLPLNFELNYADNKTLQESFLNKRIIERK